MIDETEYQSLWIDTEEKLDAWTGDIAAWNAWGAQNGGKYFEPLDPDTPVLPILTGNAAKALWKSGRKDWNAWVTANPKAHVDFTRYTFEPNETSHRSELAGRPLIDFHGYRFPEGIIVFNQAKFVEGDVSFENAKFSKGHVSFLGATFGNGNVWFDYASLGACDINFHFASFGDGCVSFTNLVFEGVARFSSLRNVGQCTEFSFESSRFEKLFDFSHEGQMGCPLDLRRTKLAHTLVVHDIRCDYVRSPAPFWRPIRRVWLRLTWKRLRKNWIRIGRDRLHAALLTLPRKSNDREDSQRFRRLKELAVANRNHTKALEFHALELQAARGHDVTGFTAWLHRLYALTSDYGRSVVRPAIGLAVCWGVFAALFWWMRDPFEKLPETVLKRIGANEPTEWAAMSYSASNMFAFIPTGGAARQQAVDLLFRGFLPWDAIFLSGVQTLLSGLLLFLLGLGLRNMFRV